MNPVFEINVNKSQMIYVLVFFYYQIVPVDILERSVQVYVPINVMVVTTSMVCVTPDVDQDGEETTVMKVNSFL